MWYDGSQDEVIRVYPLSVDVFKDIYEVKCYFDCRLKYEHKGKFYCNTTLGDIGQGTLVLFQYDSHIVAHASYMDTQENDSSNDHKHYEHYMSFDVESIKYLDSPIANQEFEQITGKKLGQAKHILKDAEIHKSLRTRLVKQDEINN